MNDEQMRKAFEQWYMSGDLDTPSEEFDLQTGLNFRPGSYRLTRTAELFQAFLAGQAKQAARAEPVAFRTIVFRGTKHEKRTEWAGTSPEVWPTVKKNLDSYGIEYEIAYAQPQSQPRKAVPDGLRDLVAQVMQDTWDDFTGDTGHIPSDLKIHGPRTTQVTFIAGHWADMVGEWIEERLKGQESDHEF